MLRSSVCNGLFGSFLSSTPLLVHWDVLLIDRCRIVVIETTPLIEAYCLRIYVGFNKIAFLAACEVLRERKHYFAVATALHIVADGNTPEDCRLAVDINPNYSNWFTFVYQEHRIVALYKLVRMIFVVDTDEPAVFEQHFTTNRVIRLPFFITRWSP